MKHFEVYRAGCTAQKIPLNQRAIPKEEVEARNTATAEFVVVLHNELLGANRPFRHRQGVLDSFLVQPKPAVETWSSSGLTDKIIRFVAETDQVRHKFKFYLL